MSKIKVTNPASLVATFKAMPDEALVDLHTLRALLSRSKTTIYRDIREGRLPHPIKFGFANRWTAGQIRAALNKCAG